MEIYIDSADRNIVENFTGFQFLDGITTTPTFFCKHNIKNIDDEIRALSEIVDGSVHVEAWGENSEEIIQHGKKNASLGKNIVSKIPVSAEGIKAVEVLKKEGIKTNMHLIFSVNQAILAAKAGADYVCPLIGRLHDISGNSLDILENIVKVIKGNNLQTKVMASSIRSPEDIEKALLCGVDAITIPPPIFEAMFRHPLTNAGIEIFEKDALLLCQIGRIMKTGEDLPIIHENSILIEALTVMTEKNIGLCIVLDHHQEVCGIITDGDIRRMLKKDRNGIQSNVSDIMNQHPLSVDPSCTTREALNLMEEKRITTLIVTDSGGQLVGYANLHDILKGVDN